MYQEDEVDKSVQRAKTQTVAEKAEAELADEQESLSDNIKYY